MWAAFPKAPKRERESAEDEWVETATYPGAMQIEPPQLESE